MRIKQTPLQSAGRAWVSPDYRRRPSRFKAVPIFRKSRRACYAAPFLTGWSKARGAHHGENPGRPDSDGIEGRYLHVAGENPRQDAGGAHAADRARGQAEGAGAVLPGGLHPALLLSEPGQEMVSRDRED